MSAVSLNANHMAINARVIGANEHESHYIFDLLMNNSTEIVPDMLSTDTHGVNHVNFALLDLFGYRFAPRYAQVGRVINELFNITEDKNQQVHISLRKADQHAAYHGSLGHHPADCRLFGSAQDQSGQVSA